GHGSFAFLMNLWESGSSHAWAAVNHHGEILFVDPQSGLVATPGTSLYGHQGIPDPANLVALDALVVDAQGRPLPFPGKPDGWWHPRTSPPAPQTPTAPGTHPGADPSIPTTASMSAVDIDVQAMEDRLLQSLDGEFRDQLDASTRKATKTAKHLLREMGTVTSALGGDIELVGTERLVKSARSLARAYATLQATERPAPGTFLAAAKDRVRFAIRMPEKGYGNAVEGGIELLGRLRYRTTRLVNFWQGHGRHNGLNATVVNASDFAFEVQFPTALSWSAGERTHRWYEVLRLPTIPYAARVDAFLRIVAVNKELDMAGHQPDQLRRLTITKNVNSTFAQWVAARPAEWSAYLKALHDEGAGFDDVLARHALTRADVFPHETRRGGNHAGVRLSDDHEGRRDERGDQRDRLRGPSDTPASGSAVERPTAGVDLRTGGGGGVPLRPGVPGPEPADRSEDGGGDSAADLVDAAAERGDPDGDVRGGGAERLGLGPAGEPDGGSFELIPTDKGTTIRLNTRLGQTRGTVGNAFEISAHYLHDYERKEEIGSALVLGRRYDVRALQWNHSRADGFGNPDFLMREHPADQGSYGDFKRLTPPALGQESRRDLSRKVERPLRSAFSQDPRIAVAVVDGRDEHLPIDDAVRGVRRALGFWRSSGHLVRPEHRIIVFADNGGWVTWRGDTGEISVST
ncbi:toxin glutamine deamidase domain-containing protein, partial [Actinoplanes sp. RD1]|uniref:toxin glutamine deamidase domain-containing protein n=1 Tax=Actinoplanes sp. RD1 TaxID=3064538 RepID=UPI002741C7FA